MSLIMDVTVKSRILIVDNDPRVGLDLQVMLEPKGYHVLVVKGVGQSLLGQALLDANNFRPHVAIVDMRLLDDFSDDQSGLILLKGLYSTRCILHSAYLTPHLVREAMELGVASVVGKDEPQQLLDAIARAAFHSSASRRSITIHKPPLWTSERIISTIFTTNVLAEVVDDVLSQLFPESNVLTLETIDGAIVSPGSIGRGHSVVLKAWHNRKEPLIVKLAQSERIIEESQNFYQHIKGNLRGSFHAIIESKPITFWELGGILYSFVGTPTKQISNLAHFYRDQQPTAILRPLKHFFADVWGDLYKDSSESYESLFQAYDKALGLEVRLKDFSNKEEYKVFSSIPLSLPNPVSWVLRHKDDSVIPHSRQAITHGDLHGDNLFVDKSHAWAIDFERSGPGPILRDFVELGVDICTRLLYLPQTDLRSLYEFAIALSTPLSPKKAIPQTRELANAPDIRKALSVIEGLRRLALETTLYSDSREFLWGLLLDALFVASLLSEKDLQRERALLLGSILCSRLEHWGQEWPPNGWPRFQIESDISPQSNSKDYEKGTKTMLPPEQQVSLMVLAESTRFLFSELGKKLDFWRRKKGDKPPKIIEPKTSHNASPIMKLDDLEQSVDVERLGRLRNRIENSLDILKKLTRELDGHRNQRLTDTLLDPKERSYLDNRIPDLEKEIEEEGSKLHGWLETIYEEQKS